jgi:hypothetical protein
VFTRNLVRRLAEPDLTLVQIAKRLQIEVRQLAASVGRDRGTPRRDGIPDLVQSDIGAGDRQGNPRQCTVAAGVRWRPDIPGDVVIADDDGVCIVARSEAADILARARAREEKEEALRRRYAGGELGLDIHNMRERLKEKGLRYVDANDL